MHFTRRAYNKFLVKKYIFPIFPFINFLLPFHLHKVIIHPTELKAKHLHTFTFLLCIFQNLPKVCNTPTHTQAQWTTEAEWSERSKFIKLQHKNMQQIFFLANLFYYCHKGKYGWFLEFSFYVGQWLKCYKENVLDDIKKYYNNRKFNVFSVFFHLCQNIVF